MIYITGDTHIPVDIHKLSSKRFKEQKNLSKSDCLIICGDFGGVWDGSNEEKHWLNWFQQKNFTTLFVDGNHENHDLLKNAYDTINIFGGKAHKIRNGIYHLKRGEIYNIDGKTFFTMGGASSHDKEYRIEGKNWWTDELPSAEQLHMAQNSLNSVNWSVDYVITHCAPSDIQSTIKPHYPQDNLTEFLSTIKLKLKYEHWFFGHYHEDMQIDSKHTCVYEKIIRI